jgi:hypothetical protein
MREEKTSGETELFFWCRALSEFETKTDGRAPTICEFLMCPLLPDYPRCMPRSFACPIPPPYLRASALPPTTPVLWFDTGERIRA